MRNLVMGLVACLLLGGCATPQQLRQAPAAPDFVDPVPVPNLPPYRPPEDRAE